MTATPLPATVRLLVVAIGLTPLTVLAVARWRVGRVLAALVGSAMVAGAVLLLMRSGSPLPQLGALWRRLLLNSYVTFPPSGLALVGAAWTTAAVAVRARRRGLLVVAGWLGAVAALGVALGAVALPVSTVVRGGSLMLTGGQGAGAALGLTVAVAAPVLAHRTARASPSTAGAAGPRDPGCGSPRRAASSPSSPCSSRVRSPTARSSSTSFPTARWRHASQLS